MEKDAWTLLFLSVKGVIVFVQLIGLSATGNVLILIVLLRKILTTAEHVEIRARILTFPIVVEASVLAKILILATADPAAQRARILNIPYVVLVSVTLKRTFRLMLSTADYVAQSARLIFPYVVEVRVETLLLTFRMILATAAIVAMRALNLALPHVVMEDAVIVALN